MAARRLLVTFSLVALLASANGCLVPAGKAKSLAAQNRSLSERNEALAVQLDNLKVHTESIEDMLLRAEEDLAMMEGQSGSTRNDWIPSELSGNTVRPPSSLSGTCTPNRSPTGADLRPLRQSRLRTRRWCQQTRHRYPV